MTTAEQQRAYLAQFGEQVGYLDFGRVGPPSRAAVEASGAALARLHDAGDGTAAGLAGARDRMLGAAARLSGFPAHAVTPVPNTSTGLFQAAFALRGEVLVSSREFPANMYPWVRAREAGLLAVRPVSPRGSRVTPEAVERALRPETTALAVSAVDFATGYRADLAGLREVLGDRVLVVDGIQGFGVADLPWHLADVLSVGGQKWLRGGWGSGFLAVSDRVLPRLSPLLSGWSGVQDPGTYDGMVHGRLPGAGQLSLTYSSPVADAALAAAMELLETVGVGWVERRVRERVAELYELLHDSGAHVLSPDEPADRAGIVAFSVPGVPTAALAGPLAAAGVAATLHEDRVRLGVHATTRREGLLQVADVVAAARRRT